MNTRNHDADLAERIPDLLFEHPPGLSGMAMALALRAPYPNIRKELVELERLGVILKERTGTATRWVLG